MSAVQPARLNHSPIPNVPEPRCTPVLISFHTFSYHDLTQDVDWHRRGISIGTDRIIRCTWSILLLQSVVCPRPAPVANVPIVIRSSVHHSSFLASEPTSARHFMSRSMMLSDSAWIWQLCYIIPILFGIRKAFKAALEGGRNALYPVSSV